MLRQRSMGLSGGRAGGVEEEGGAVTPRSVGGITPNSARRAANAAWESQQEDAERAMGSVSRVSATDRSLQQLLERLSCVSDPDELSNSGDSPDE